MSRALFDGLKWCLRQMLQNLEKVLRLLVWAALKVYRLIHRELPVLGHHLMVCLDYPALVIFLKLVIDHHHPLVLVTLGCPSSRIL